MLPDCRTTSGRADIPSFPGVSHHDVYVLAVLEDALRCYWSPVDRVRIEAAHWAANTRRDSPFCFPTVCEMLGLDAEAVRLAMAQKRAVYASPRRALRRSRPNVRRASRVVPRSVQPRSGLRR